MSGIVALGWSEGPAPGEVTIELQQVSYYGTPYDLGDLLGLRRAVADAGCVMKADLAGRYGVGFLFGEAHLEYKIRITGRTEDVIKLAALKDKR